MLNRLLLIRLTPILAALGLAAAPLDPLYSNLINFDLLVWDNVLLLVNYLLTGVGVALVFIVIYHVSMQNDKFTKRDAFFFLAGPAIGFLMAVGGATQFDIIQYTFVVNLGLGGLKDLLKKVTGIDLNGTAPVTGLTPGDSATVYMHVPPNTTADTHPVPEAQDPSKHGG